MKNFENYFKKEKWAKVLLVFGILFLIPFFSNAGSIRDVSQNMERVKSNKAPFQFVTVGDSRDGGEEDGILYLISGGGGAPLSSIKESGGYFHYVWISAGKERIEGEAVDLEGRIRDRFMIK